MGSLKAKTNCKTNCIVLFTVALLTALLLCGTLVGCSGANSIVGSWTSEKGDEVLIFRDDNTCEIPFTYSGAWLESCDRYTLQDDGTLVLSSSKGNVRSQTYSKTDDKAKASAHDYDYYGKGAPYYLSGNELIINGTIYERS